jgi:DNA-binding IclR family transcriptional regulator
MATASMKRKPATQRSPKKVQEDLHAAAQEPEVEAKAGEDDQYFSRAVAKAFHILDLLHLWGRPVTLNEMAQHAGLTKSSCFRLLHTLERLHFVAQQEDGRYIIAERNWVNSATQVAQALLRGPQEVARQLNEEFRETVSIGVLFTNHIEVVQTFESSRVLRMTNTVGRILPPHASSMGKAIAAFQAEAKCKQLLVSYGLQRITEHTIVDELMLRQEFEKVRSRGYAHEAEESTKDGACFGAPIMLEGGTSQRNAVAAISISMPKSRVPEGADKDHMIQRLQSAAETIGSHLSVAILKRD